jgi:NAD(P)H-hydrate epimerase
VIEAAAGFPAARASTVPSVTARTMAEIDDLAVDEFGLDILQMMEQAGSHLAELVRVELGGDLQGKRVVVAVGPGNNGGGGLAAARHLANRGASVRVILARPVNRLGEAGRHQLSTLLQMSVDCCVAIYDLPDDELDREFASADAVVDAVLGYRASGAPHDGVLWLVERVAQAAGPVISLDLPSGIDADTGEAPGSAVTASATLTLALPKPGLFQGAGPEHTGRVFLADIGIPGALYRRLGLDVATPFARGRIVRLEAEP